MLFDDYQQHGVYSSQKQFVSFTSTEIIESVLKALAVTLYCFTRLMPTYEKFVQQ